MINLGDGAAATKTITAQEVDCFCELSGDRNPIHLDEDFARKSQFGRRIVPGLLVGSYISALLANDLPGPGTIYLRQTLEFLAPVFIGDTLTTSVTVVEIPKPGKAVLVTQCQNQGGILVLQGSALVKLPWGENDEQN